MLIASLYFIHNENRNWMFVALIGFVMQIIACIGLYFLPESPKFLIEQNRITEAKQCLEYIAKINGV